MNFVKYMNRFLSIFFVFISVATVFACSNNQDNNSVSNTPTEAINDYIQSINNKDCEKIISLQSSDFKKVSERERTNDFAKYCEKLLGGGNGPYVSVTNMEVISDNGIEAQVSNDMTFNNESINYSKTIHGTASLVKENGEWKIAKF